MKAHLIKSKELDKEMFTRVVTLLEAVPGPIKFAYAEDAVIDFEADELYEKTILDEKEFVQKKSYDSYLPVSYTHLTLPTNREV